MQTVEKYFDRRIFFALLVMSFGIMGCKKLVNVNAPVTSTSASIVYSSDATAIAVLNGLYAKISAGGIGAGTISGLSLYLGLAGDEFTLSPLVNTNPLNAYYANSLGSQVAGYEFWNTLYPYIYTCNLALQNLDGSTMLTPAVKQQLQGECYFMRAFFYFYLVNLYGNVPIVTSTDYKSNALLPRSPTNDVYEQIISDLKAASALLSVNYLDVTLLNSTTARVRPTKWSALALLSRAYLYTQDYQDAELASDSVINTALYKLSTLSGVFLENNTEAIWQLQPVNSSGVTNTYDGYTFVIPATGFSALNPVSMSSYLLSSFEAGDMRRLNWVDSIKIANVLYYFPYKYKVSKVGAPVSEYTMMLRLGEQYLIRAEARAQIGESNATDDLNTIRVRAGLANYSGATDKGSLLAAILHERRVELFTELGQRWLDLKRTENIDSLMDVVSPAKGGLQWASYKQLFPISVAELQNDPNLTQNSGY